MRRTKINARYHQIFQQVDRMLWNDAEDTTRSVECRRTQIRRDAEYMKASMAAYIDAYADMLDGLITNGKFSRFPVRGSNRPGMWKAILERISLAMIHARVAWRLRRRADAPVPRDQKRNRCHQ